MHKVVGQVKTLTPAVRSASTFQLKPQSLDITYKSKDMRHLPEIEVVREARERSVNARMQVFYCLTQVDGSVVRCLNSAAFTSPKFTLGSGLTEARAVRPASHHAQSRLDWLTCSMCHMQV